MILTRVCDTIEWLYVVNKNPTGLLYFTNHSNPTGVPRLCILERNTAHMCPCSPYNCCLFPSGSWLIGHQWRHAPWMRVNRLGNQGQQNPSSPYHPLGRQSRISCICGQTRPPPLPRIARLPRKPRQCGLYFPNPFLRVGIHITMWCASGVWDFQDLAV